MEYDIKKDLPGQKEKLWKVLVDWCRGIRMYAEIEISDYNSKFLYSELPDQKLRSNFLSLYNYKSHFRHGTGTLSCQKVRKYGYNYKTKSFSWIYLSSISLQSWFQTN